ncbi:hypothetical protein GM921_10425 [Pedobacter sp. LMG 31464]|uniref:Membrane protein involved in the export of O-antigen and teichoic acid n=1 Tax=Pedobacter planticolens TaxID=2679964 RepID=A0A923IVI7_9SPHI|nr:hypothetical protein [Pedobacter planticolens]MBB2145903.1 hypothetical protein [Pedobacter planticolens]
MSKLASYKNIDRIWNSPTLMTWLSYSTKALALFGILPLVLNRFSSGDIVLWYLFSTIISLQSIADFGFRQTFSRIISYAFGGAKDIEIFKTDKVNKLSDHNEGPNKLLLNQIVSTMKSMYLWLTLIVFILMAIFGTWSMYHPITDASNITEAWWGWWLVLIVSVAGFYSKIYLNFLEGLNKIALVRRIETLTSIGAILTSILVLYLAPTLLNLVIVNQFWVIVVLLRDIYLCRTVDDGIYKHVAKKLPFDKHIFQKVWQPAWRSGISGFMSVGLTNLTGLIYAQIGNAHEVASYLLALRIINQIKEVSMAPFYSKLPVLAMLRVKENLKELIHVCKRGMFLSHMVFIIGFITVGFSANWLLTLIHSQVPFVNQKLWMLLGIAFFVHRFGAMHIQVYMSTNHIISHIADGVSGILYIISSLVLSQYIGIYAVPIGMLVGYLGFYAWYAAKYSYQSLQVNAWQFEKSTSALAVLILILYILISSKMNYGKI